MKRLLCYAHFDGDGELKPFVKHALKSVSSCCSTIIFVSNSPLPEKEIAELRTMCQVVLVKENTGYDFSMWKTALAQVDYLEYDQVVLMNSSVYGPFFGLESTFEEMERRECDFWGITECFQHQPHVQSYFLVFKRQVITSPAFASFWNSVLSYRDKTQIILNYEVGLTVWLREANFRMDALFNSFRVGHLLLGGRRRLNRKQNVSVHYAVELLHWGNPFLKVEPVRRGAVTAAMVEKRLGDLCYPMELLATPQAVTQSCPVCGGNGKLARKIRNYVIPHDRGSYHYHKCQNSECGIIWLLNPPAKAAGVPWIEEFAAAEIGSNDGLAGIFFKVMDRALGLLKRRRSLFLHGLDQARAGSLLEIGCGRGHRLRALKSLGWKVMGMAPGADPSVAAELRSAGIDLVTGEGMEGNFPACHFDAVIVSTVMEQADPLPLLRECLRILKPGGTIHLSTSNAGALTHSLFGRYWSGFGAPRNLLVPSRKGLTGLLDTAGFSNVRVKTVSCNAEIYAMQSLDAARYRLSSPFTESRIGREFQSLAIQLLCSLVNALKRDVGDECVAVACKRG